MSEDSSTETVRLNGDLREVPRGLTVHELLEHLELVPATIVVERNKTILKREAYVNEKVEAGDEFELVHFVGGG